MTSLETYCRNEANRIAGRLVGNLHDAIEGELLKAMQDTHDDAITAAKPKHGSPEYAQKQADELVLEAMHTLLDPSLMAGDEWPEVLRVLIECPAASDRIKRGVRALRDAAETYRLAHWPEEFEGEEEAGPPSREERQNELADIRYEEARDNAREDAA